MVVFVRRTIVVDTRLEFVARTLGPYRVDPIDPRVPQALRASGVRRAAPVERSGHRSVQQSAPAARDRRFLLRSSSSHLQSLMVMSADGLMGRVLAERRATAIDD